MANEAKSTVIGTFEGECADANITNNNGLDITRPVWEHVFESEEYKSGIEHGWYIGFLGHPEDDPGCQNFQEACIVMTEGHIEDDGKVYGKFNLIDTPVGRIVKAFIDGGVTFGISVRGAGDIINNSVDPETFTFRGFDLVAFPAYPESIPTFTEIAASSDIEKQRTYKKICAAVEVELPNITSSETLDMLGEQFPEQSDTYQAIEDRKAEIQEVHEDLEDVSKSPEVELLEDQLNGVMELYLDEKRRADALELEVAASTKVQKKQAIEMNRKLHTVHRICAQQENDVRRLEGEVVAENLDLKSKNKIVVTANTKLKSQLEKEKDQVILASTQLQEAQDQLTSQKSLYEKEHEENLQYQTKIQASEAVVAERDATIRSLQEKLDKTVVEATTATKRASNLEGKVEKLTHQITAAQDLIAEYQDAYANYYAQAVGVSLKDIPVTASTTVAELQDAITGQVSSVARSTVFVEPQQIELEDEDNDLNLITL